MRAVIISGILAVLFSGCSSHQSAMEKQKSEQATTGPVKLQITADLRQGFAPVSVSFKAELVGVSETDPAYYCLQEEWDFGDGSVSSDKPNCEPYAAGSKVTHEFFVEHVYQNEGI